jgi:uncharacterized lipoprotein
MKTKTIMALAGLSIALSGCVMNNTVPINYAPSSVLSASGSVTVTDFSYLPAQTGKVQPNQVRNTALGSILFDQNVSTIFRDAVFKELRFVGVNMNSVNRKLSGEIQEFLIDDLGFSVTCTLRVKYQVTDKGGVVYEQVKATQRTTGKFGNPFGAINETIKLNIEELIKDKDFLAVLNGG